MELNVLGPMELLDHHQQPVVLPGGRARIVLAVLALHSGQAVSSGRLAEAAWADSPPATARAQVQALVSALRRALTRAGAAPQPLETHGSGYLLSTRALRCDLWQFSEHVRQGRAAARHPAEQVRRLRFALSLWRGAAFDGLPSALLEAEAARWEETRLGVLEECLEAELRLAPRPDLVAELRAHSAAHPLRETAHRLLMFGLYRAGRPAEALTAFDEARRTLVSELGVEPGPSLTALRQQILTLDPALPAAETSWSTSPPPAGKAVRIELFGRDSDVAATAALVATRRIVTLVGPPGVGKTQLARAVADLAAHRGGPDGVWTVGLDAVTRPESVPSAVAAALGVPLGPDRPLIETLAVVLADRQALLVLDNCEHVLDACAELADRLTARSGGLHVLATSREPLAVAGEVVRQVEPLSVPAGDTVEDVRDTAAGRMFLDRAAARTPGLTLTPDDAPHVARICRMAEGLPLALELVAAQLRLLPLAELADRMDRQLEVLARRRSTPNRHRSLDAAIDWSHQLLTGHEQRVLARLSVFAGGFTPSAVTAVAGDTTVDGHATVRSPAVPETVLWDLVERSLVVSEPSAGRTGRFRLLQPVREYAARRLCDLGEQRTVRARHAAHYSAMAARVDQEATGLKADERWEAKQRVRRELANLRSALDWSLGPDGDAETGMALVGATSWLWVGLPGEGKEWAGQALARLQDAPAAARPRALLAAGLILHSTDLADSAALLTRAAHLARENGDPATQLQALAQLSVARCLQGRCAEAVGIAEEVLAAVLRYGNEFEAARARIAVGLARCGAGDASVAAMHLTRAEEVFVRLGAHDDLATTRWAQAEVAYYSGHPARAVQLSAAALRDTEDGEDLFATVCRHAQQARNLHATGETRAGREHLHRALRHCLDEGLWMPAVDALTTAARIEADGGDPTRALTLLTAAHSLRTSTGREPTPMELPSLRALEQRLHHGTSREHRASAQKEGAALGPEAALHYALATGRPQGPGQGSRNPVEPGCVA
ncbi:BTAD domain-containing putative transcriptional regulator [Streptomyces sp. NPDC059525]|uniref:BTAD domain-containing putative transcriptional regulator n=1 Tax=Streptomyces sp. NPDC059525 TaxID=3346857 RepID=UPI0036AAB45E